MLKPSGFFADNPALDLPPERNEASKDQRSPGACCG
jgi:primary-amine oxidase